MSRVRYVMVTHWKDHWDRVNRTYYPFKMLKGLNVDGVRENSKLGKIPTIFIKVKKDNKEFERAWKGYTYDFEVSESERRIYFEVQTSQEIDPPQKYLKLHEGWYVEYVEEGDLLESLFEKAVFYPPIFYLLIRTTNWYDFENLVYYLLKLLGIHDIIKYERQRGLPDGFFKFRNFAVVYDATLEDDFERLKDQQIDNYCNLLKRGEIRSGKTSFKVSGCKKQIWIITKGASREIRKIDDIIVKEVSVYDLIDLYIERLKQNFNEDEFEERLMILR